LIEKQGFDEPAFFIHFLVCHTELRPKVSNKTPTPVSVRRCPSSAKMSGANI
jgi:hypothetical protein